MLDDKVAIITGAGTGIGAAIAHKFAREGARLALGGLPTDPVRDVAQTIIANGGDAEAYTGDLAEESEACALVNLAIRRFGRIDILISNAGYSLPTQKPVPTGSRTLTERFEATSLPPS